jgi:hypothetical protein
MMSSDANVARLRAHHQNIERYERLLKTKLTELEVKFLQKRLWEERFWMAMLTKDREVPAALQPDLLIDEQALERARAAARAAPVGKAS